MKDPLEEASAGISRRIASGILLASIVFLVGLFVLSPGARIPLAIVGGLVLMVMLHEAGHYWTAKRAGMKVTEFFLGFGPRLWSFQRGETEYGVKALPLGGYVRIIGMNNLEEVDPEDEPRTYRAASYKNRLIVVLAGVTVNIVIALVLFGVVIAGRGFADGPSTTVGLTVERSAAAYAGIEPGDRLLSVGGEQISTWDDLKAAVEPRGGELTQVVVVRDGEQLTLDVIPAERDGTGFLGISPTTKFRHVPIWEAAIESPKMAGEVAWNTGAAVVRLFSPSGVAQYSDNFTGNAPKAGSTQDQERVRSLVGIVDQGSDIVAGDIWLLLVLLGGLSLVLALFNLLPLPPFDGGHAAVVGYEWAASKMTGRKVVVDYRKLTPVAAIVLIFFLTLSMSAMFLDVRQAIGR